MTGYGQFCPIAKTMEVLDERWTILIVRELLVGSSHFNELRRGLPRLSPALLSKRLRSLARCGIVVRNTEGNRVRYELTTGGRELAPVVMALGEWGVRWRSRLGDEDLDPHLLMWDVHRNLDQNAMPATRTVLAFSFSDVEPRGRDWWIVVEPGAEVDLCDFDPGYPVTVSARSSLRTMVRLWRGDISWQHALRTGDLQLAGTRQACHAFPHWLRRSMFASVPRPTQPSPISTPPAGNASR
ncbi:MAG: winged helix-turn-helix transcriptional regulator [Sciscionella sp.]